MPPPPSSSNLSPPNPEPAAGALEDDRHISQTRQIADAAGDGEPRASAPTPLPGKRPFSNTLVTSVVPPPERASDAAAARASDAAPAPAERPSRPTAPGAQEKEQPPRSGPPPLPKSRSNPGFPAPPIAAPLARTRS